MRRVFLTAVLALALPLAAYANNVEFTDHSGTLTGSAAGLTLIGSELTEVDGLGGLGLIQGTLGSMSFTTGMLTSGSLMNGGTFGAGGTFVITGNGTSGIPNTTLFTGSFSGPVSWTLFTLSNGTHQYMLAGIITGTLYTGQTVNGLAVVETINTGKRLFNGSISVVSADTGVSAVPEPGTLGLLGTGLIGLAGIVRRKLKT